MMAAEEVVVVVVQFQDMMSAVIRKGRMDGWRCKNKS